ncbi:LysM peptidoglycan-binding domain-containing protein [Limnochorda pilosa]|uniref:LysM domain-containing protein n=1 Tax=Limnochorda pilosa TaxID=1555112 RepID=A0A0K2SG02_LIMPI|nr:LysM peptidoglycan-binding domain-containing protein [Limnochorda pilosa]BAS26033.1 hypothetical protein LIP_0176 [Limnochorda pilosa]
MGRPTQGGGRSPRELPARDWIGGYRPRLRSAARPAATWAGVAEPQPAPYLAPALEEEMIDISEEQPDEAAGVVFGYAARDATDPYVVALRALPFPQVEPLEGGLRIPRQSWWTLSRRWQEEIPDLEPVGWFRLQAGRGTSLGSYDRFTAHQRFADPLQFTWVLDPERGRQALYRWEGADLVPVPGYWRCTETPEVPARELPPRGSSAPAARRAGALAGILALKSWLVVAAAAAVVYLALPFAPGSIPSLVRPAGRTTPEAPPPAEPPLPLVAWSGGDGGSEAGPGRSGPTGLAGPSDGAGEPEIPSPSLEWEMEPPAPGQEDVGSPLPAPAAASSTGSEDALGRGSAPRYATHTVRRGETLWRISLRLLGDPTRYREIADLNGISNPHHLETGRVLLIPTDAVDALK